MSAMPSHQPSDQPSLFPSDMPSDQPSLSPSDEPSQQPSECVDEPDWKLVDSNGVETGFDCDDLTTSAMCISSSDFNYPHPSGKDAHLACCTCGGGQHIPNAGA